MESTDDSSTVRWHIRLSPQQTADWEDGNDECADDVIAALAAGVLADLQLPEDDTMISVDVVDDGVRDDPEEDAETVCLLAIAGIPQDRVEAVRIQIAILFADTRLEECRTEHPLPFAEALYFEITLCRSDARQYGADDLANDLCDRVRQALAESGIAATPEAERGDTPGTYYLKIPGILPGDLATAQAVAADLFPHSTCEEIDEDTWCEATGEQIDENDDEWREEEDDWNTDPQE